MISPLCGFHFNSFDFLLFTKITNSNWELQYISKVPAVLCCVCVLPSAELLDTVKASVWIVTSDIGHTEGEDPYFVALL